MLTLSAVSHYPKIGDKPEEQVLRRAHGQLDRKEIDEAGLERIKDEVTRHALQEQVEAGLEIVTDGQIRWDDAVTYLAGKIKGFKLTGLLRYFDTNTFYRQPVCEADLEAPDSLVVKDFQFANALSSVPVKALLTGPFTLAKLSKDLHYKDFEEFAGRLAVILGEEAQRLARVGATIIQFDEPALLQFKKEFPVFKKIWTKLARLLPEGIETVLFLNYGDLRGLYPQILEVPVTAVGLDLATAPENWRLLGKSPFTKKLLAGLVDARNTKMETEEELHERLERALDFVSAENLSLSPNYGLEFLPRETARKKLAHLSKVVREFREAKVKA
ncbi:MAG: hypothetical protein HYU34_05755 [Candidatus Omnitrophica bacterium]|nr:hypothetical protein [Candidatus Omnitrophota bacterium]